ncbi:TPA: hypothetical protein ACX6R4_002624 [Photobacterium damselae]
MATKSKQQKVIEQFYKLLDDNIEESLSYEQRTAVEDAITMLSVASMHKVDIRKSFPFWGKRYYVAFLLGHDLRKSSRNESSLWALFISVLIVIGGITTVSLAILSLYLIKSALGIDVFHNFSFGVWDWFKSLFLGS